MCIRDSFKTGSLERRFAPQNVLPIAASGINLRYEHRRDHRCLLYTSDAADERSSVDLGGRRIIKKKQLQIYGGMQVLVKNRTYERKKTR